jgi:hypothetical protein
MMEDNKYFKCKYCSLLHHFIDLNNHNDNCINNFDNGKGILSCYSCGNENGDYSSSQLNSKGSYARCKDCVLNNKVDKYEKYGHLYGLFMNPNEIKFKHINDHLNYSVNTLNINNVKQLLDQDADPNYIRQDSFKHGSVNVNWYLNDGTEKPEIDETQPTTPLKLCVFRISDCMLTDENSQAIVEIAKVLIQNNATKIEALEYFKYRYGVREEDELYKLLLLI